MSRHQLDARNLLCPMPVIRTQDRVATLAPGDMLEVFCTDPGALNDIPAWCRLNGHRVLETRRDGRDVVLVVEVGGEER
ncbi:sulfurtransferase TusA family protein [Thioalbus denitrificans]|uniref:tRNA 2-thiouridine synthesizing protein A n=1 Tax=Thioalbus denitrificans TaxID=547122 RepID=A0A369CGP6_9GAMM|nr:sulfurtransferase TusA family protein [Thioalbus denitrificans]RCX33240.1 tRNA 2-thiouridine synthesizing protein A [Thioalbus denitrificans]